MACVPETPWGITGLPVFDVRKFGAAGDGEADDTRAIQSTVDAAQRACGGIVFFPPGVYVHRAMVIFPSSMTFAGIRGASILKLGDGAAPQTGVNMYQNGHTDRGDSDVSFTGLTFDGNKAGNPNGKAYGLFAVGMSRLIVEQCVFRDFPALPGDQGEPSEGDGIFVKAARDGSALTQSTDCIIRDSWFYNNERNGIGLVNGRRILLSGLNGEGNFHSLMDIEPDESFDVIENVLVQACTSGGGGRYGFIVANGVGKSVTDVRFVACYARNHGIHGFVIDHGVRRTRFAECVALCNGGAADGAGIQITDATDTTVVGGETSNVDGAATQKWGIRETGTTDRTLVFGVRARGRNPRGGQNFAKSGRNSLFRENVTGSDSAE